MIRRPPRSTLDRSSAASDVYKRQVFRGEALHRIGASLIHRLAGFDVMLDFVFIQAGEGDKTGGEDLPDAVSYTHLRAHETVLDIVCRLLLAKKKKTKQAIIQMTHVSRPPVATT